MTVEKLHFKTSSGIKSIVGKDLITDKFVAIFELVKNSYDAGAKKVTITFDLDKITILDDGHGMSKDDLIEKWLNLAYSEKKEGKINNERAFVGSKGIGRFSADRLGTKLRISTKIANEEIFHRLEVDWDEFDKDLSTRFEEVNLDYSFGQSKKSKEESYTRIEISKLNENWTIDEVNKAKENLRRLKNPFLKNDGFKILVIDKNDLANSKEYIESNIAEVLKDKSITIEAEINSDLNVRLYDRGDLIYEIKSPNDSLLKDVPIKFFINYLTTSAKAIFKRRMGITVGQFGNIFIYKNGFRVMPYGEEMADLFGLNIRKGQGYSRYISTRELIGYIDIKDFNNFHFKEASSRDSGFVNNIYLNELEKIYMSFIQRPLEAYIQLIDWGEIRVDQKNGIYEEKFFSDTNNSEVEKFKKYIKSSQNEILFFRENISFENNKPEKKLEKIVENISNEEKKVIEPLIKEVKKQVGDLKRASEENEKIVKEKEKNIEILERQAKNLALKRSESSYSEQLNHHLTLFSKRIGTVIEGLAELEGKLIDSDHKSELRAKKRTLRRTADEMVAFRDILSKSDLDAKSPQTINWIDLLKWRVENTDFPINVSVLCEGNISKFWTIKVNILEFVLMVDNFINNAEEHGAKYIEFEFKEESLLIKSDSSAIESDLLEKVFQLGVSTKKNGTGIGLNQIQKSLKKLNMNISVRNENNLVCFEVLRGE
ncbi:ATP-binding protein [Acinetobacter junii]|uniref:ATP-binding protein n=1 Tax=Acinetobacter junii TaxID=40215 RepID=UPI00125081BE|nr:ATP-binding protein [Acinetobacter junii]MDH1914738.1 ATP-binding protein [Acinetobacter junii]